MTPILNRRALMKAAAVFGAGAVVPTSLHADEIFAPRTGSWRRFEVVTRVELTTPVGKSQAWIPLPSVSESDWFQSNGSSWRTNGRASVHIDATSDAQMLYVQWDEREQSPVIEVMNEVATRDRAVDFTAPGAVQPLS